MKAVFIKTQFFLFIASAAFAASPAIGIVTASGHFTLERSEVWGNSTLFEGSTVETGQASSSLALRNGARLELGAASKVKVFANRAVLEKGVGVVAGPYEIDAAGLKISSAGARLRIAMTDRVEVAVVSGAARVTTGGGLLLASIPAGRSMSFSMQAGATGVVARTGCLVYKDGHYLLQDENTQEVSELSGGPAVMKLLHDNTGNRIEINGNTIAAKPAVAVATVSITVSALTAKSQGGCLSVASALDAQTEAPASSGAPSNVATQAPKASGGGMGTGTKIAIVAAIIGGGAGAALALAGKKGSTSP